MAPRRDERLIYYALGVKRANVQAIRDLKNLAAAFRIELKALRREVRELKDERERARRIERALEVERDYGVRLH